MTHRLSLMAFPQHFMLWQCKLTMAF